MTGADIEEVLAEVSGSSQVLIVTCGADLVVWRYKHAGTGLEADFTCPCASLCNFSMGIVVWKCHLGIIGSPGQLSR